MMNLKIGFSILLLTLLMSCNKDEDLTNMPVDAGNDPNFTIESNPNTDFSSFNRRVNVFGIHIYAVPQVEDNKLLHAANVMAQYLDNDEDGNPDNQVVLDRMLEEEAFMVMWKKENDLSDFPNVGTGQDLGNDETNPSYISSGKTGRFDASLEEVFHIITHAGYSKVYPDIFGEMKGSQIANAMDIARGGQFTSVPNSYPSGAWYTYDDTTCDYNCQVTEYFYWAITSILGAQENRLDEIDQEWRLNTREKVENQDPTIVELLTNPQYAFPTIIPDGSYRR